MSFLYNNSNSELAKGNIDYNSQTFRIALLSDRGDYIPDPENEFVTDVFDSVQEFEDASYSRKDITNLSVSTDSEGATIIEADSPIWNNLTGDRVRSAIIYKQVGGDDTTPGDDVLIAYITASGLPYEPKGRNFRLKFESGIMLGYLNA